VVLYTDGLVERRRRPLDAGLDVLLSSAERGHHLGPPGLAEHLLQDLAGEGPHQDDVCVLAATLSAPR
jgi:hypothetical protein